MLQPDKKNSKAKPLDPEEFTKDYIQSPKYLERLKKSSYLNPEKVVESRLKSIKETKTINQNGSPGMIDQLISKVKNVPYSTQGSMYSPSEKTIIMDPKTDKGYFKTKSIGYRGIKAHELGHAELNGEEMNKKDNGELFNRLKTYKLDEDFFEKDKKNLFNKSIKNNFSNLPHDLRPDENKSDINSLRFLLKKDNIHDAGKEDFTEDHLNRIKSNFVKDRLLKNYDKEDLIWIMNNIAKNKDNKIKNKQELS